MDRRTTKPPFIPPDGYPITLRPDVLSVGPFSSRIQVWIGPHDTIEGSSHMDGPDGDHAAYRDVIDQLVNLAYFHYTNYLDSIAYSQEEERGTSFDDSAE